MSDCSQRSLPGETRLRLALGLLVNLHVMLVVWVRYISIHDVNVSDAFETSDVGDAPIWLYSI